MLSEMHPFQSLMVWLYLHENMYLTAYFGAPVENDGAALLFRSYRKALVGERFEYSASIERYPVATPKQREPDQDIGLPHLA